MNGKISQWKDDKGFGFITSDDGKNVFFHISSVTPKGRRPQIGDIVEFKSAIDGQNRHKATRVGIQGLTKPMERQDVMYVEPKRKNAFDYLLIAILFVSFAMIVKSYLDLKNFDQSVIFGIPAVIAFILLSRQKKPKSSSFCCTKCKKLELFDKRTISAWNRGLTRLYCNACHIQWLKNNPKQRNNHVSNKGSGCLGTFALMIGVAALGGYSIINWLV